MNSETPQDKSHVFASSFNMTFWVWTDEKDWNHQNNVLLNPLFFSKWSNSIEWSTMSNATERSNKIRRNVFPLSSTSGTGVVSIPKLGMKLGNPRVVPPLLPQPLWLRFIPLTQVKNWLWCIYLSVSDMILQKTNYHFLYGLWKQLSIVRR